MQSDGEHGARLLTVTTFCSFNECNQCSENTWDIQAWTEEQWILEKYARKRAMDQDSLL